MESSHGQGQSNTIIRSDITLADAVQAAITLKKELKLSKFEFTLDCDDAGKDDYSKVHAVAGFIRNDILAMNIDPNTSPYPNDICDAKNAKHLPPLLFRFISWMLDKETYKSANPLSDKHDKIGECVSITECIIANSQKVLTPLNVGLAVRLHNEYGSKTLIETLNAHGYCMTYDETRRFTTSVALQEADRIANGVYLPSGIISREDGGGLITEGDDNVDINTETIDGKETFHSLARVKFQWQKRDTLVHHHITVLQRQHKSLPMTDKTESLMKCDDFEKPKLRPEPPRVENAVEIVRADQTSFKQTRGTAWILLCLLS